MLLVVPCSGTTWIGSPSIRVRKRAVSASVRHLSGGRMMRLFLGAPYVGNMPLGCATATPGIWVVAKAPAELTGGEGT